MELLIAIMTIDPNFLVQVLYQDQSTVELIGEVKKAYTLRALKKSTRAPTNVSNAKRAVTCSIFPLRIGNHLLPYLVGTTALEKRQSRITKKRNARL